MYQCEHCEAAFHSFFSLRSHQNGSVFRGLPRCARKTVRERDDTSDVIVGDDEAVITTPQVRGEVTQCDELVRNLLAVLLLGCPPSVCSRSAHARCSASFVIVCRVRVGF